MTVTLTENEKALLRKMIFDGYFFDDLTTDFITWGVDGKANGGTLTSLNKKGVVRVNNWGSDGVAIDCGEGFNKYDIAELSGWNEVLPLGAGYKVEKSDVINEGC